MKTTALTIALLLGLVTGSAWAQSNGAKPKDKAGSVPEASSTASAAGASYVIGADDTLHIDVWKEPDLTATLPVRPDGKISMPLLNDVQAAGLTPMQLATSLTEKLKKYLADPRVTVVVTQMTSQRFYVLGEVLHSGAIPLLPNMTVLQALATAGFTQVANNNGIYVVPTDKGKQQEMTFNYKQGMNGDVTAQDMTLR